MTAKKWTTKDKVRWLLQTYPATRDNDRHLIALFWEKELKRIGLDVQTNTISDFMHLFTDNHLTDTESIRRSRQKLQEDEPDLRGRRWHERHEIAEVVKNNIVTKKSLF